MSTDDHCFKKENLVFYQDFVIKTKNLKMALDLDEHGYSVI